MSRLSVAGSDAGGSELDTEGRDLSMARYSSFQSPSSDIDPYAGDPLSSYPGFAPDPPLERSGSFAASGRKKSEGSAEGSAAASGRSEGPTGPAPRGGRKGPPSQSTAGNGRLDKDKADSMALVLLADNDEQATARIASSRQEFISHLDRTRLTCKEFAQRSQADAIATARSARSQRQLRFDDSTRLGHARLAARTQEQKNRHAMLLEESRKAAAARIAAAEARLEVYKKKLSGADDADPTAAGAGAGATSASGVQEDHSTVDFDDLMASAAYAAFEEDPQQPRQSVYLPDEDPVPDAALTQSEAADDKEKEKEPVPGDAAEEGAAPAEGADVSDAHSGANVNADVEPPAPALTEAEVAAILADLTAAERLNRAAVESEYTAALSRLAVEQVAAHRKAEARAAVSSTAWNAGPIAIAAMQGHLRPSQVPRRVNPSTGETWWSSSGATTQARPQPMAAAAHPFSSPTASQNTQPLGYAAGPAVPTDPQYGRDSSGVLAGVLSGDAAGPAVRHSPPYTLPPDVPADWLSRDPIPAPPPDHPLGLWTNGFGSLANGSAPDTTVPELLASLAEAYQHQDHSALVATMTPIPQGILPRAVATIEVVEAAAREALYGCERIALQQRLLAGGMVPEAVAMLPEWRAGDVVKDYPEPMNVPVPVARPHSAAEPDSVLPAIAKTFNVPALASSFVYHTPSTTTARLASTASPASPTTLPLITRPAPTAPASHYHVPYASTSPVASPVPIDAPAPHLWWTKQSAPEPAPEPYAVLPPHVPTPLSTSIFASLTAPPSAMPPQPVTPQFQEPPPPSEELARRIEQISQEVTAVQHAATRAVEEATSAVATSQNSAVAGELAQLREQVSILSQRLGNSMPMVPSPPQPGPNMKRQQSMSKLMDRAKDAEATSVALQKVLDRLDHLEMSLESRTAGMDSRLEARESAAAQQYAEGASYVMGELTRLHTLSTIVGLVSRQDSGATADLLHLMNQPAVRSEAPAVSSQSDPLHVSVMPSAAAIGPRVVTVPGRPESPPFVIPPLAVTPATPAVNEPGLDLDLGPFQQGDDASSISSSHESGAGQVVDSTDDLFTSMPAETQAEAVTPADASLPEPPAEEPAPAVTPADASLPEPPAEEPAPAVTPADASLPEPPAEEPAPAAVEGEPKSEKSPPEEVNADSQATTETISEEPQVVVRGSVTNEPTPRTTSTLTSQEPQPPGSAAKTAPNLLTTEPLDKIKRASSHLVLDTGRSSSETALPKAKRLSFDSNVVEPQPTELQRKPSKAALFLAEKRAKMAAANADSSGLEAPAEPAASGGSPRLSEPEDSDVKPLSKKNTLALLKQKKEEAALRRSNSTLNTAE